MKQEFVGYRQYLSTTVHEMTLCYMFQLAEYVAAFKFCCNNYNHDN